MHSVFSLFPPAYAFIDQLNEHCKKKANRGRLQIADFGFRIADLEKEDRRERIERRLWIADCGFRIGEGMEHRGKTEGAGGSREYGTVSTTYWSRKAVVHQEKFTLTIFAVPSDVIAKMWV